MDAIPLRPAVRKRIRALAAFLLAVIALLSLSPAGAAAELSYAPDGPYTVSRYYTALRDVRLTGNYAVDLVNVALSQVGYREGNCSADLAGTNVFGELNYTEYGRWFGLPHSEWCAMFVSWCARQARIPESVVDSASFATADDFGVRFRERGSYTPKPGDLIIFDWTYNGFNRAEPYSAHGDHVGIVFFSDDRYVYYVDGNLDDFVEKRRMALDDPNLKGYGTYENNSGDYNEEDFGKLTDDCVLCTGGVIDPYDNVRYAVLPFDDVRESDVYYDAVFWSYENAVTAGVTAVKFAPESTCTRAQMVTFLWRSLGRPAPAGEGPGFTDAVENAYYSEALTWAVENGIINGTGGGRFSPDRSITRGQLMTILHRLAGSPAAGSAAYSDVPADSYYARAIAWAADLGIIAEGEYGAAFSPDSPCLRGQIVLYMHRFFMSL